MFGVAPFIFDSCFCTCVPIIFVIICSFLFLFLLSLTLTFLILGGQQLHAALYSKKDATPKRNSSSHPSPTLYDTLHNQRLIWIPGANIKNQILNTF